MRVTAERATAAQGPVLGAGSALEAGLRGEAALGIGAKGCDYCIVSTPRGIEVRAMGSVRGRWTPEPSARYRIDLGAATVRYWRGEVLLDEVPHEASTGPLRAWALFAERGAEVVSAVVR